MSPLRLLVVGLVVVGGLALALWGAVASQRDDDSTTQVQSTSPTTVSISSTSTTVEPTSAPATLASDQLYLVGDEMPAGRWEAVAPAPECEWVRLANVPENEDDLDVIAEGKATVVVLESTDTSFMSWDCGRWQLVPT